MIYFAIRLDKFRGSTPGEDDAHYARVDVLGDHRCVALAGKIHEDDYVKPTRSWWISNKSACMDSFRNVINNNEDFDQEFFIAVTYQINSTCRR